MSINCVWNARKHIAFNGQRHGMMRLMIENWRIVKRSHFYCFIGIWEMLIHHKSQCNWNVWKESFRYEMRNHYFYFVHVWCHLSHFESTWNTLPRDESLLSVRNDSILYRKLTDLKLEANIHESDLVRIKSIISFQFICHQKCINSQQFVIQCGNGCAHCAQCTVANNIV